MELKEFIKTTILDITDAVRELQDIKNGALISPGCNKCRRASMLNKLDNEENSNIDFELYISEEQSNNINGEIKSKISVLPALLGAKVGGLSEGKNLNASKIRFSIPIIYPIKGVTYIEKTDKE